MVDKCGGKRAHQSKKALGFDKEISYFERTEYSENVLFELSNKCALKIYNY